MPTGKVTILGAALGDMILIGFARYPDKSSNRPCVDHEASAVTHSGELLGVVFGVLLNLLLPVILIVAFLAALLSYDPYVILRKDASNCTNETEKMKEGALAQSQ